jgi:hypothetical protein
VIAHVPLMFCDRTCGTVFEGCADEDLNRFLRRAERQGWTIIDGADHYCESCAQQNHIGETSFDQVKQTS